MTLTWYDLDITYSISSIICGHMKRKISLECHRVWAEDSPFVSGVVVCCQCHWESRPQEGGGIAQVWAPWSEDALALNGTAMCWGYGVWRWRHRQWGRQQFCCFFNLKNMPCSVLPWQAAWQVILIGLRLVWNYHNAAPRAKIWRYDTLQKFKFFVNPLEPAVFSQFELNSNVPKKGSYESERLNLLTFEIRAEWPS